jgi:RHS repeat-associated protein
VSLCAGTGGQQGQWIAGTAEPVFVQPREEPDSISWRLTAIVDDQGRYAEYDLDPLGRMLAARFNETYAGTNLVSYCQTDYFYDGGLGPPEPGNQYNSHLWLQRIRNSWHWTEEMGQAHERTLVQNDYTYSNSGNRLTNQISDQNGPVRTEGYGYDQLSRLTAVDYGDGETQGYSFDPMGNRLSKIDNVTGNESYLYNAANMLTQRASQPYVNDANGNTLTGGGRTNTWDSQNRLAACVFNANVSAFVYGPDGLRRRSTVNTTVTDYVLDGQSAIRTLQAGAAAETFLTGPRGPEYQRAGNNAAVWYLYDGLGSVLGTVDCSGNIISTRKYDVYGAVRDSSGPSGTKHKYCGALGHPSEDETGLLYMRARFMDPVTGRFASEDPARSGNNWHTYVSDNPVNLVDDSGRDVGPPGGNFNKALLSGAFGLILAIVLGFFFAWGYWLGSWGDTGQFGLFARISLFLDAAAFLAAFLGELLGNAILSNFGNLGDFLFAGGVTAWSGGVVGVLAGIGAGHAFRAGQVLFFIFLVDHPEY